MSPPRLVRALALALLLAMPLLACGGAGRGDPTSAPAAEAPAGEAPDATAPRATEPAVGEALQTLVAEATPPATPDEATAIPAPPEAAPLADDAIAYVRVGARDEIRLIAPDGSNDRPFWAYGGDPEQRVTISGLDWRPDGRELAFVSNHELACSINRRDLFAIAADGTGERRITQAPACAELATYPRGTVRVPVQNANLHGESFSGLVYFQGAPSAQFVSLGPGESAVILFEEVADFGEGVLQLATMIIGIEREVSVATLVDVVANETVETGMMDLFSTALTWEAHSPTWHSDGSRIAHVLNSSSLMALPARPTPLDMGIPLLETELADLVAYAHQLRWGPAERPTSLLYVGNVDFDGESIYLVEEGSAGGGERLLDFPIEESVLGLAWLPDGSGFIYSAVESDEYFQAVRANLFLYDLESGAAERLTDFADEFTGQLTVSPGGERVVFERGALLGIFGNSLDYADLWILDRDRGELTLLVEDGRLPAWGAGMRR